MDTIMKKEIKKFVMIQNAKDRPGFVIVANRNGFVHSVFTL